MRLNFEFTNEQVDMMNRLKLQTGVSSMKELFGNAFTMLEWAVSEVKKGHEIAAVSSQSNTYRVFVTPLLRQAAVEALTRRMEEAPARVLTANDCVEITEIPAISGLLPQRKTPVVAQGTPGKMLSLEEFDASLDELAQYSEKIPSLPDAALSRENFYQDHD